jgi:hypothetical protein
MARARRKSLPDNRHVELAASLQAWAKQNGFLESPYVKGLLAALSEKKNLALWAELDPFEQLPVKRIENRSRSIFIARITLLRNLLVFAPVALTWAAVSQATTAFGEYTKANPESISNFLDFWQDGYGYLDSKWTIGDVAFLDFLLVAAVIVLTTLISFLSDNNRKKLEVARDKAILERQSIALAIIEYLHDKRAINNVTMNKTLANAISKLLNATDHIETSTKGLQKAIAANSKTSPASESGKRPASRSSRKASESLVSEETSLDFELPDRLKKLLES